MTSNGSIGIELFRGTLAVTCNCLSQEILKHASIKTITLAHKVACYAERNPLKNTSFQAVCVLLTTATGTVVSQFLPFTSLDWKQAVVAASVGYLVDRIWKPKSSCLAQILESFPGGFLSRGGAVVMNSCKVVRLMRKSAEVDAAESTKRVEKRSFVNLW